MKRAAKLAAKEGITEAHAFAKLAEANPSLFSKAKGKPNVSPTADDDLDDAQADTDPEPDDAPPNEGRG